MYTRTHERTYVRTYVRSLQRVSHCARSCGPVTSALAEDDGPGPGVGESSDAAESNEAHRSGLIGGAVGRHSGGSEVVHTYVLVWRLGGAGGPRVALGWHSGGGMRWHSGGTRVVADSHSGGTWVALGWLPSGAGRVLGYVRASHLGGSRVA